MFFYQYLSNVKSLFADNWRAEQTIFSTEQISFSLKLLSGYFYGKSCNKTVQGPLPLASGQIVKLVPSCSN